MVRSRSGGTASFAYCYLWPMAFGVVPGTTEPKIDTSMWNKQQKKRFHDFRFAHFIVAIGTNHGSPNVTIPKEKRVVRIAFLEQILKWEVEVEGATKFSPVFRWGFVRFLDFSENYNVDVDYLKVSLYPLGVSCQIWTPQAKLGHFATRNQGK